MHTTDTEDKFKIQNSKKKINFICRGLFTCCLLLSVLPAYAQNNELEKPQGYARQSDDYYRLAVKEYKRLIARGRDLDRLRFELGQLYYSRGDFSQAIEEFKDNKTAQAKKSLAISYYRLGNFTDALDIFDQNDSSDPEYLYYYGLTCEKLNLFDQGVKVYKKINSGDFVSLATDRVGAIVRQAKRLDIQEIAPGTSQILARAPAPEKYPQAGALILSCDEKIEITADYKQVSELHYLVKIINERGKEDFSEVHIDYDSTYEKVELEYARAIRPDGTVAEVSSRNLRDVSKYLNFPLYSNVRVFIISFPEISAGTAIEYKVKIYRHQLINKKDFILSYPVQSSEPVIAASFSLSVPKEMPIHLKSLNEQYNNFTANLAPRIENGGNRTTYTWDFKDIPQIVPEANMPPQARINPAFLVSTFSSWQEIHQWWWNLAKDKINADSAIKEKVKALTVPFNTAEEKIRALANFCAKEIRYVAVEYGQAGHEPHQAADIFGNKYGDCKDQAILLVTMLREAGFSAWPVLIATRDHFDLDPDFPSLPFNHAIAAVGLGERIVFLDPTAQTCPFDDLPEGDQERRVLLIKDTGYEIKETPLYPPEHNLLRQEVKVRINPDESIEAKKDIFSYGIFDQAQRYWLWYTQPETIEETLKEKIQDISIGAKLDGYSIKNLPDLNQPVILSYSFSGPEYLTVAGSLRIMPQLAGLDTSLVAREKRKYALDFGVLDSKELIFEVAIPDNFVVKYMPQGVSQDSPWMKFESQYLAKEGKIIFKQNMRLKKNEVPEGEYPDFKEFFESLAKKIKQRIVIERVK